MSSHDGKPLETLRLSERDKQRLLIELETKRARPIDDEQRDLRVKYTDSSVVVTLTNPSGNEIRHLVLPRNLSRQGLAFLHGQFVYANSPCEVELRTVDGEAVSIQGVISRCQHIGGILHEVAVRFVEPVDLALFVDLSPEQKEQLRREQAKDLQIGGDGSAERDGKGMVLLVDDYSTDLELFKVWISQAGLQPVAATSPSAAIQEIRRMSFDLVVIDAHLGIDSGLDLIRRMRSMGFGAPILAVSADENPDLPKLAEGAGANQFLTKPIDPETLRQTLEQLTSVDVEGGQNSQAIYSTLGNNPEMMPLLEQFVAGAADHAATLRQSSVSDDLDFIQRVCQQLKGSGTAYGFEPVTRFAKAVLEDINTSEPDPAKLQQSINELIQVLRRVQLQGV